MVDLFGKRDDDKIKRAVLGLMYLSTFKEANGYRVWKAYDWEVLDQLYEDGYIGNPKTKVRSVNLTDKGRELSEKIFTADFCIPADYNTIIKAQRTEIESLKSQLELNREAYKKVSRALKELEPTDQEGEL